MDVKEAMRIFNIRSIEEVNHTNIKKIWKKLMLQAHPDAGGDHALAVKYNSAYEMLKGLADNTENIAVVIGDAEQKRTIRMKLNELISIYNDGKEIEYRNESNDTIKVCKYNINKFRVLLEIPIEVTFKGNTGITTSIVVKNIKDDYSVAVKVEDDNRFEPADIEVKVHNKCIKVKMMQTILGCIFRLDSNICVHVQIERVDVRGQKDTESVNN